MMPHQSILRGLSLCALAAAASSICAQEDESWMRHFRIGASVMMNVSTEFKTSGTFAVNRPAPGSRGGVSYDDGFVGVDATGNATPPGGSGPATTFWGYNDASQVNETDKLLTYHGTDSFSTSAFDKINDTPIGFDMVYATTIRKWERLAIGGEFGFGFNIFDARDRRPLNATLSQTVAQHDISAIPIFPDPPYVGPESGQPSTPGGSAPVLPANPVSSQQQTVSGAIHGSRSLEGILYNFRLGPMLRWEFYPRWTLNGSAGGALAIFDATYRFNESISSSAGASLSNKGKFGSTDLKYGGYAGAVVMYDTGNQWEPYLGAHFLTMQDGKLSSGGREATMHLGAAVYITAGINWTF
jgi:hypothetical protein